MELFGLVLKIYKEGRQRVQSVAQQQQHAITFFAGQYFPD